MAQQYQTAVQNHPSCTITEKQTIASDTDVNPDEFHVCSTLQRLYAVCTASMCSSARSSVQCAIYSACTTTAEFNQAQCAILWTSIRPFQLYTIELGTMYNVPHFTAVHIYSTHMRTGSSRHLWYRSVFPHVPGGHTLADIL